MQTLGHALKLLYFGELMLAGGDGVPPLALGLAVVLAMLGTSLSRRVLEAMTDTGFRIWTRRIIAAVSVVYLAQGLWLTITRDGAPAAAASITATQPR